MEENFLHQIHFRLMKLHMNETQKHRHAHNKCDNNTNDPTTAPEWRLVELECGWMIHSG